MKTFQDKQGRDWEIALTYSTVKRCRDVAKIDILDIANPEQSQNSLARLFDDPIFVADVLHEVCFKQREHEKLNRDEFCEAVIAVTPTARQALIEELHDFFHRAQMSDHCAMVKRGQEMVEKIVQKQRERLNQDSDELLKNLLG